MSGIELSRLVLACAPLPDSSVPPSVRRIWVLSNTSDDDVLQQMRTTRASILVVINLAEHENVHEFLVQHAAAHGTPDGVMMYCAAAGSADGWARLNLICAKVFHSYVQQARVPFWMHVVRGDGAQGQAGVGGVGAAERYAPNGLSKTISLEWDTVSTKCVDVHVAIPGACALALLLREIDTWDGAREIAYSVDTVRKISVTRPVVLYPSSVAHRATTFLVSGGARGITPQCLAAIARARPMCQFYLLGRSEAPRDAEPEWASNVATPNLHQHATAHLKKVHAAGGEKPSVSLIRSLVSSVAARREICASIDTIRKAGGSATYHCCDVTSTVSLEAFLATIDAAAVTGIVHAAGVLRDSLIATKKMVDFDTVYGTKVKGLHVMLRAVQKNRQLREVLLFSSLAGVHGNVGQSDYAMANEYLSKAAYALRKEGVYALACCFGPWDGGMVTQKLRERFETLGVQIIPEGRGAQVVADLMQLDETQVLVGGWKAPVPTSVRAATTRSSHTTPCSIRGRFPSPSSQSQLANIPLAVTGYDCWFACGRGGDALWDAVRAQTTCLRSTGRGSSVLPGYNSMAGYVETDLRYEDLLGEVVERAVKNAELVVDARTGVIVTELSFPTASDYATCQSLYQNEAPTGAFHTDQSVAIAARLGAGSVHFSLDAACASALYVLQIAQHLLATRQVDSVVCAGICFPDPQYVVGGFTTFNAISATHARPFDAQTDGLTYGDGVAAFVVRRSQDALERGDTVCGVITHIQTNNAGTGGVFSPSKDAQMACMRTAAAPVPTFLECHATGTPLGDRCEAEGVEAVYGAVHVGSVKALIGHTLNTAGFASLVKALHIVESGVLPASAGHVTRSVLKTAHLLEKEVSVDKRDLTVAINSFGFGGSNAHMRVQPAAACASIPAPPPLDGAIDMDIIAIDLRIGSVDGIDAFRRMLMDGGNACSPFPLHRWRGLDQSMRVPAGGCWVDTVEINYRECALSMRSDEQLRPQHLLALSVLHRAVKTSGLVAGSNVAVLVALGMDHSINAAHARSAGVKLDAPSQNSTTASSYIGSTLPTRLSSIWDFKGPSFTITDGTRSVVRAIDTARLLLAAHTVDAVVVGAVDIASAENVWQIRDQEAVSDVDRPCSPFDKEYKGVFVAEGCGVVVLTRCMETADRAAVHAVIEGKARGKRLDMVQFSGTDPRAELEHAASTGDDSGGGSYSCRLFGCVSANVGQLRYASGIIEIITASMCMHERFIPPIPNWSAPRLPLEGFFVPLCLKSWALPLPLSRRVAVVVGQHSMVVTDSGTQHTVHNMRTLDPDTPVLLVVEADTVDALPLAVEQTEWDRYLPPTVACAAVRATVSIVASRSTFAAEAERAAAGVRQCLLEQAASWTSDAGSVFLSTPVGFEANICSVYNDVGFTYYDMEDGIGLSVPSAHAYLEARFPTLPSAATAAPAATRSEHAQLKHAWNRDLARRMECGVRFSACQTHLMEEVLQLPLAAATGVSMGELSMLLAFSADNAARADVLRDRSCSSTCLRAVTGTLECLRREWGLSDSVRVEDTVGAWFVTTPVEELHETVCTAGKGRVHICVVHDATRSFVIGDLTCFDAVQKLNAGCKCVKVPILLVAHCSLVEPHRQEISSLVDGFESLVGNSEAAVNLRGIVRRPALLTEFATTQDVRAAWFKIARNCADMRVRVRQACEEHAVQLFLGVGPGPYDVDAGSICPKARAVVSLNSLHGGDYWGALVRACARLAAHGKRPRIDRLYHPETFSAKAGGGCACPSKTTPLERYDPGTTALFNYNDLLEFAEGRIGKVFGAQFDVVDTFPRRVMLPMRDYLLVTRVTAMDATVGEYRPSSMTTEYDIPIQGSFSGGGAVPWAVAVEAGQCDLMLISYIGVDFQMRGERVYRLLDTTLTFYETPLEGQTLQYKIRIDSFAKEKDKLLFFFSYDCYVDGKYCIKMRGGCAGFFTDQELDAGKGVVFTDRQQALRHAKQPRRSAPFELDNGVSTLSQLDMQLLCDRRWVDVFGASCQGLALHFSTPKTLMIDRVTHLLPGKGPHGFGLVVGEKDLAPTDWFFPCHFRNDQVLAGSLVSEGCFQLLKIYATSLGLHTTFERPYYRALYDQPVKVRCRGQIAPHVGTLVYLLEINAIEANGCGIMLRGDVQVLDLGESEQFRMEDYKRYGTGDGGYKIKVDFRGVGIQVAESDAVPVCANSGPPVRTGTGPTTVAPTTGTSGHTTSSDTQPPSLETSQTATTLFWHPLAGVDGNPTPGFVPSAFPPRRIHFVPFPGNEKDANHSPGVMPLTWYNISEFSNGRVAECFGPAFARLDKPGARVSRMPGFELAFVTRIIDATNTCNAGATKGGDACCMVSEFDCPVDAWFWSRDGTMPYSVLMELGLQTSGFASALTAVLRLDYDDAKFRNLDATAHLIAMPALAGKTITNVTRANTFSKLGKNAIHTFSFELSVDGAVFYKGDTSFGWFPAETFDTMAGIDNGKSVEPWYVQSGRVDEIVWNSSPCGHRPDLLRLPHRTGVLLDGGEHGKGYCYADRTIDAADWWFSAHFWHDPAMPGSLGVECMHSMLEEIGYGHRLVGPITHRLGKTMWKYRGQITPYNTKMMKVEVHVKDVIPGADGTVTLLANGSLWNDSIRLYRVDEFAIVMCAPAARAHITPVAPQLTCHGLTLPPYGGKSSIVNGADASPHRCGFCEAYDLTYPLYTGAMAKGISSAELVIAMARHGMLASFGAGGLPLDKVEAGIRKIKEATANVFAVNLIHSPFNPSLERGCVDLCLEYGVTVVEASAFMNMTYEVVRYRVLGVYRDAGGKVGSKHHILAKISRTEVATHFLHPPPSSILDALVRNGDVTPEQARMASELQHMCTDLVVESRSGGHTDLRSQNVILPLMIAMRNECAPAVRVGAAGGMGHPLAVKAAFAMGAEFVVTGTVNQMTREAGTSDVVRKMLSEATYSDVKMAAAADMFAANVKLCVLSKNTLFAPRANKLYEVWAAYGDICKIPAKTRQTIEGWFQLSMDQVWDCVVSYYEQKLVGDRGKLDRARTDPKLRLQMIFVWYLSISSQWANEGVPGRQADYQIWCGEAIGTWNEWTRGTRLDPTVSGCYPSVVDVNHALMQGNQTM